MASKTILHEYEAWLEKRRASGEITESTCQTYMNDASRVFEVLLQAIPPNVVEGYMHAAGYRRQYRHVIEALRAMARPRKRLVFNAPGEGQERLPGV